MNTQATLQRAFAVHQAGKLAEAEFLYNSVLAADKNQFDALHMLGVIEGQRGNYDAALERMSKALRIRPNSAEAHTNISRIYGELGNYERAAASLKKALALNPRFAVGHNNYSIVLRRLQRNEEALQHSDKAIALEPKYADAWTNRGNVLFDLRRFADALASYDRALAINSAMAEAWLGRANVLKEFRRLDDALTAYDRALAANPRLAEAWFGRGTVLNTLRRFDSAFAAFDKAFALKPELENLEGDRLVAKMQICDWSDLDAECGRLAANVQKRAASTPFCLLPTHDSPADQLACARRFVAGKYPAAASPLWKNERYDHARIRVAYLSADFRNHAVSYLMAGVIEAHDRARFETIGISFCPDESSPIRDRMKGAFERFFDVQDRSDADIARLLRDLEVDIAVDLMGHTGNARMAIFSFRPAPVQATYLGYAGTTGAKYMDYILADRFVVPAGQENLYSEAVACLPDTFMPADSGRTSPADAPSRAELGLPEDGFVFCSFNKSYKITPPVFSVWMRLLNAVPGSVLWLSGMSGAAMENLRREAVARGVQADRLIFAARLDTNDAHMARHRAADLFLDTRPYNAHTGAVDALWCGVPLVTCPGASFASRVAGSVLQAAGLSELIAGSLDEYEATALRVARDPDLLASLKNKLALQRQTCALFDTGRLTRHLEAAYVTMFERQRQGGRPRAFDVQPVQ